MNSKSMLPRDYILNQINHIETPVVPFTIGFEAPVREMLNNHFGNTSWDKNLYPYMRTVAHVDNCGMRQIDGVYHRDAYGSVWRMDRWHVETPVLPEASFDGYKFPDASFFTDPIYRNLENIQKECEKQKDYFKVIDMGWGIFERSWIMRGFENALVDTLAEPDFYEELVNRVADIYVESIKACSDIDADGFLFGDDWGDQRGIIMGAESWRRFIKPCWKRVYDEVHKQNKKVMSHSCGSISDILDDAIEIGLDVYESVQPEPENMHPSDLKRKFGDRITFWGCFGTQSIIPHGTPEEVKAEMKRLASEMGKGGGYILAPTKQLQEDTPLENALAIIETLGEMNPFIH